MLNVIPGLGWFLDLFFKISLSIPFWIIWTGFGIGEKYFYFLPPVYLRPGFWDCVGVFIVVPILKGIFVPRFVTSSSSSETNKK
jgi:hypothetical protein